MDPQEFPNPPENSTASSRVLNGVQNRVIGDVVTIRQGIAQSVEANNMTMRQAGVVKATTVQAIMDSSAAGWSTSDSLHLHNSTAVVLTSKGATTLDQSSAQVLATASTVSMDQSAVAVLASRDVTVNNSAIVFLIAGKVNGNITPLFGSKEAAVFGAAAGLVGTILYFALSILRKKK